ncbi:DUF3800 domain-containing protein [Butyrivibrio sp. AE2032]|uniref:DUF3800 domain-containing protein n=1 Tax=Butyrivibrio sp. AE2032 TaxID=1458463 RepID=UPI0005593161|nr:DUF3800 domain-containing protein [Butyrivibrio sp. AE2032]
MAKRVLSCFIDESGDFGPYEAHSPYYYVAIVLHDQSDDISDKIAGLNQRAANEGFSDCLEKSSAATFSFTCLY